jgi:hypothetical protein
MKINFKELLCSLNFIFGILPVAGAQYYYKDIWNNQQIAHEFAILKKNDLKTIKVNSFDGDGQPSQGFFCEKKIDRRFTQSQMISKSNVTGQSVLTTDYNQEGFPTKTVEETPTTTNTTYFSYDSSEHLTLVTIFTKADADSGGITETRAYNYNKSGNPVKMIRKRNNAILSVIDFVIDSLGNVIEEDVEGNSSLDKKYYYYYDTKNRLTDVVHFNERAGRLLPNYMFEYTPDNKISQMITTEEGSSDYFTWLYEYNNQGLKESEKCYAKDKSLLGTIDYEYNN